jgi:hypothetical protein
MRGGGMQGGETPPRRGGSFAVPIPRWSISYTLSLSQSGKPQAFASHGKPSWVKASLSEYEQVL